MRWIAHKFGGSSVANAARYQAVARLMLARQDEAQVVVVSAMQGVTDAFPSNADYTSVLEGATQKALTAVSSGTLASTAGVWGRKANSALNLGILPVFHS